MLIPWPVPSGFDSWKDFWATVNSLVTSITAPLVLFIGAFWTYRLYRRFRQAEENAVLTIRPKGVWCRGQYVLYIELDVQNVGNVEIRGERCRVGVVPMIGPTRAKPLAPQEWNLLQAPADATGGIHWNRRHYVLDKGEFNTFVFSVPIPFPGGDRNPTACLIEAEYVSARVRQGGHVVWMRQAIYACEPPARPFDPTDAGHPARAEIDLLLNELRKDLAEWVNRFADALKKELDLS